MSGCEFAKKRNGNGGEDKPETKSVETPREFVVPRIQPELDRRRSSRKGYPKESRKKSR